MLTKDEVMRLNAYMLGLGAPIEKDDAGYNAADFAVMETLGHLCVALSDEETYAILDRLWKYTGRQLYDYRDEIAETKQFYYDRIKDLYLDEDDLAITLSAIREGIGHTKADFTPREIVLLSKNSDGVFLKFGEYMETLPAGGKWKKLDEATFAIFVPYEKLADFLTACRTLGKYGYVPSAEVSDVLTRVPELLAERDRKAQESVAAAASPISLIDENRTNEYNCMIFSFDRYSREFSDLLWRGRDAGALTYVNPVRPDPPKTEISVKKTQLEKLKKFCKEQGFDYSCLVRREEKEAWEKEHWNDSGNTLCDVSKLTLPFTPYPFQVEDATAIVSKKRALIGHDMGCGKTFIASLVGMSIDTPKLVICPESLRLNWLRELQRFHQGADIKVVYSKDARPEFGKDWTVMGYKTATKHRNSILAKRIDCVFIDESHAMKSVSNFGVPDSQRAQAMMEITKYATYTYLMTGTPMPTRSKDLYNELCTLHVINPEAPYAFHRFGTKFCGAENNGFGWDYNGASNQEELHELLSTVMTRRLKKDVLPNLTKQRQFIPLEEVSAEYKSIESKLRHPGDDDTYMGLAMTGRRLLSKVKVKPTLDLAESFLDADQPVVIVTEFNETMDALLAAYTDKSGVCHASCIRGGMADEDKQKAIDDFQNGTNKVCVVNTIAGGVGVTLTAAHNMIICDYDWTPANMTQVEDRICRAGQTECCNIYYMFCENAILDRAFVDMITDKSATIDRVVDAAENTVDLAGTKDANSSYLEALKARLAAEGAEVKKRKPAAKKKKKEEKEETPEATEAEPER
jgi:hypothetical protein